MATKQNDGDDGQFEHPEEHDPASQDGLAHDTEWGETAAEPLNDFGEEAPAHEGHTGEEAGFDDLGQEPGHSEDSGEPESEPRARGNMFSRSNLVFYGGGSLLAVVVLGIAYSQFVSHGNSSAESVLHHPPIIQAQSKTTHAAPTAEQQNAPGASPLSQSSQDMASAQPHTAPSANLPPSTASSVVAQPTPSTTSPAGNQIAAAPQTTLPAGTIAAEPVSSAASAATAMSEGLATPSSEPVASSPASAPGSLQGESPSAPASLAPASLAVSPVKPAATALATGSQPSTSMAAPQEHERAQRSISTAAALGVAPTVADSQLGNKVADMGVQISQLTARLDQLSSGPSGNSTSDQEVEALKREVADLKEQVATLQNSRGRASAQSESMQDQDMTAGNAAPAASNHASSRHHKTASRHHAKSSVRKHGKTAMQSHWVLRSATPGVAWISTGNDSDDLKRVVPGDSVSGIGKVTAVRQDGAHWVVEGTSGTIR